MCEKTAMKLWLVTLQDTLKHCGRYVGRHLPLAWVKLQALSLVILKPMVQLSISEKQFYPNLILITLRLCLSSYNYVLQK